MNNELPGRGSYLITAVALVLVYALTLLDGLIPPFGIPLAVVATWLFLWRQGQSLAVVGVKKPPRGLGATLALGLGGGVGIMLLGAFVYPFLLRAIGLETQDISSYEGVEGNNALLAIFLSVSWTTAGFGEELVFRGFIMAGLARILGRTRNAWIIAVVVSSVWFGLIHVRTGAGGVITTGLNGALLAGIYLASRRSIWAAYIAHGLADTLAFLAIYTGLYKSLP